MICPYCKTQITSVVDKRDNEKDPITRRRRECENCKRRFTTYERVENIDLEVEKKSGRIEPFNRNKLRAGIFHAVRKQISEDKIDEIVEQIELELSQRRSNKVKSIEVGEMVLSKLLEIDKLSYLRFASVYKDFKEVEEFENEIQKIK
ncbi:transcriptional repressor NrdR [bacterium]|nr:MAG: transcriptional repressor NrdR [bacterium]